MTGNKKTAYELLIESIQLANSLKNLGIKSDDVVGIYSENRFEFAVVTFNSI